MIPSKKKKVHQRVHHYTLSTTQLISRTLVHPAFPSPLPSRHLFRAQGLRGPESARTHAHAVIGAAGREGRRDRPPHPDLLTYVGNFNFAILGYFGIALLFWTVISLLTRLEEAFNTIWHVLGVRTWARRFSDYLSVALAGPVFNLHRTGGYRHRIPQREHPPGRRH